MPSRENHIMSNYKNVMIAIDPLGDYQAIVERVKAITDSDSEVTIIHVHEPVVYIDMRYADVGVEANIIQEATKVIGNIGDELNVAQDRRLVESGKPAKVIHKKAEELGIDLVVVGTHGRHGVQLLLGSTANAILHGTKCDVLAVRVGNGMG